MYNRVIHRFDLYFGHDFAHFINRLWISCNKLQETCTELACLQHCLHGLRMTKFAWRWGKMWVEYNPNPAQPRAGDCAVRAVAKALDLDWESAYAKIAINGFLMGDVISSNAVWGAVLRQNGFTRKIVPNSCPDCYTLADFARDNPKGTFVVAMPGHVATVVDGDVFDSWNSLGLSPLYYWEGK